MDSWKTSETLLFRLGLQRSEMDTNPDAAGASMIVMSPQSPGMLTCAKRIMNILPTYLWVTLTQLSSSFRCSQSFCYGFVGHAYTRRSSTWPELMIRESASVPCFSFRGDVAPRRNCCA
jgi:hypothetical protein